MNFLEETKFAIAACDQCVDKIIFIGSEHTGHQCTWQQFCELANFDYDNAYGGRVVAGDLIIVFEDGTIMYREEYDGAEWWECRKPFEMPKEKHPIKSLKGWRLAPIS